ncbi:uncharacterized protein LOC144563101 isoform X2 [Carex rostrata]
MWPPLSVKHEFPEQLPLPETSPIADGNGDLVESHRLINLERSSLLMVKPEMATTLPGGNEPFECQEASPLSAQGFTGSKSLDDLPPSPPPLPWVCESTTVPEESEYKNRDPLVSDTRDSETTAPPEIRTKGISPGCLKNTIPVSVYAGGEVQFNHMGVAYSISPSVTYLGTERTTFKDVTDEIYKVLKLSEDLVSLNIQARYNAVSTGPFFFTLLAINDEKAWRLIYEMAVSGMNWRIIELYVEFVPNQTCQNYNSNPTMPHNAPVQGSCSRPNPIPRNFPIKSSRTQQNTPMHAKPSQTEPKPPLPLISELTMLESECDNVNPVTQNPRTVHKTPDQLTKACQPDVSMIPLVSGTTDTGPTGDEQMEVSQIDTNKDDEVAISDRPPTEMAPPGSDTRDSETPAPLAKRILVIPSDMKKGNSHVPKVSDGERKIQKGKGKAKAKGGKGFGNDKGKGKAPVETTSASRHKAHSDAECYYCKNKGHWKRNCALYLADLKAGNVPNSSGIFVSNVPSDVECCYCKNKGHWKRNCPLYLADLKALEIFRSRQVEASVPLDDTLEGHSMVTDAGSASTPVGLL